MPTMRPPLVKRRKRVILRMSRLIALVVATLLSAAGCAQRPTFLSDPWQASAPEGTDYSTYSALPAGCLIPVRASRLSTALAVLDSKQIVKIGSREATDFCGICG